jgi:Xaa-Pro dipeptidase
MRAQARPITNEERRARIEKAQRLMVEHKIDALMLTQGTSLVYFTNIRWGGGERLTACVIPAKDGRSSSARRSKRTGRGSRSSSGRFADATATCGPGTRTRAPTRSSQRAEGSRRRRRHARPSRRRPKFVWSDGVAQAAPALKLVSATPIVAGLPHDQGAARNRADALGFAGHAESV